MRWVVFLGALLARGGDVAWIPAAQTVEVYDIAEITMTRPSVKGNPFVDAALTGTLTGPDGRKFEVEGFCDSTDGRIYRIRFMPSEAGEYRYALRFRSGGEDVQQQGTFTAKRGKRRGPVRVDPERRFHFIWEGTGEHYFWNSTTAYALMGWKKDEDVERILERFARLRVNRIRAALIPPRVESGKQWFEPNVATTADFSFRVNVWPAMDPESLAAPGHDVTRFNTPVWQRYERMLRSAREKNIVVSVIFYVDGRVAGVDPFGKTGMGGEDEQRYYRYAIARLAAFSNVMWDVTNEYRLFRNDVWAEQMGSIIKQSDPYQHLTSVHGHGTFNFRRSSWADFAMYQSWDEKGGYAYMRKNREEQKATGRVIPQVNEEYGYESHYPQGWGDNRKAPAREADSRRRLAWEITMAGCYQTTGERADFGTGAGENTGGGWINGRGNAKMTLLEDHARMMDFFTGVEWWRMEPMTAGCENAVCLAEPGRRYVAYLAQGGQAKIQTAPGKYQVWWFNPRTGRKESLGRKDVGPAYVSPTAPDSGDWALVLSRE